VIASQSKRQREQRKQGGDDGPSTSTTVRTISKTGVTPCKTGPRGAVDRHLSADADEKWRWGGNYSSGGGDEARNRVVAREREKEQELSVRVNPNMTGIYTEPASSFHSWAGNGSPLGHGWRWALSHPVLRPNQMLIVCVPKNQVSTHTVQKMDTE
jgi:hypothetical protein